MSAQEYALHLESLLRTILNNGGIDKQAYRTAELLFLNRPHKKLDNSKNRFYASDIDSIH